MPKYPSLIVVLLVSAFIVTGCSGYGIPVTPTTDDEITAGTQDHGSQSQTHLWGYWDVIFDIPSKSVEFLPNRSVGFCVNIVKFLNNDPAGLEISFNDTSPGAGYVDVELDVTINHPFAGMEKFNGYDVCGVFIGEGSGMLEYNNDLLYPIAGADQILLNADGYTRWFNPDEFLVPGIFGYTQGDYAPKTYTGTATLNPYKYFGEGLGPADDLWGYLTSGDPNAGYFLHGTGNTRNYVIRFPIPIPGIKYGYAVTANWEGGPPEFHPAFAPEAVGCEVTDSSNVYYVDETTNGGNLVLDISVFDWDAQLSAGVMEDYQIIIESTVTSTHHNLSIAEMTPIDSGVHLYTYHVEIPADNVTDIEDNEMWVIVEDSNADYTNPFGIPNEADIDPLAACFRFDVPVSNEMPSGWARTWGGTQDDEAESVAVDHLGNVYITGYFQETVDFDPGENIEQYSSNGDRDVFLSKFDATGKFQWTRVWGGLAWDESRWVDVDESGNVYVTGFFALFVDFDPGPEVDKHTCIGGIDAFLSKFDSSGNYQWVRTWGGNGWDEGRGVAADDETGICVAGHFMNDVDFDPGDGIDNHSSNGMLDAYISMFDSDGNFQWAQVWGGELDDRCYEIAVDGLGDFYVTGFYSETVDFDPGNGTDERVSNGESDIFLSKFDASGLFKWARTWGGPGFDEGYGISTNSSGFCAVTGMFHDSVEFDTGGGTDIHSSNGVEDIFLSMFDYSGGFIWARTWGGLNPDVGHGVGLDDSGDVCATGIFMSDVDFDPGVEEDLHSSNGSTDIFLSKFGFIGDYQGVTTWGGTEGDLGFSVTKDDLDNTFVAGYFLNEVNFAPSEPPCSEDPDVHSSQGNFDAFLVKYLPDGCW